MNFSSWIYISGTVNLLMALPDFVPLWEKRSKTHVDAFWAVYVLRKHIGSAFEAATSRLKCVIDFSINRDF